ncbi:MAG: 50S ribosomal protein L22 [Candidatus Colwellbacteria bacterium CG10_big_fil_rev_8_21_14_0_10_42_22]|uniref:Large ribosomal subunit protein uL22 n=1 Tax=Candidatus Colwellbacteria bacterium CG10_big_fil_rev_8_21_14_0_10_42_22 TaxID=1974540 RepID=A0A2H0VHF7_9BACT|nr:MAG: 50S ribosomal protein L22 [Candidatus Colwellbacteria bacterium CG10_big_fil_rev_8_21_14_0_10_42_22]
MTNQVTKTVTASIKNLNVSPRKVRLVTDLIKGQPIESALAQLQMNSKRASAPISKLVKSAIANARERGFDVNKLIIDNITVDKGRVLKRGRSGGRGRVTLVEKKQSHINLILKEDNETKRPSFTIHEKPKKVKEFKERTSKKEKPKYEQDEDTKKKKKKSGFVNKFFQRKSV